MKKVVCILGSPRKNRSTETIARKFAETAEALGAQSQSFYLNGMSYQGCQGCMACKKGSEKCVLEDDLAEVFDAVRESDIVVLASPIYFGDMTAQVKGFIDRAYSLMKPTYLTEANPTRLSPGKKCVFVFTQGAPDASMFDIFEKYDRIFNRLGFQNHLIRGIGLGADKKVEEQPDLLRQAEELAREII